MSSLAQKPTWLKNRLRQKRVEATARRLSGFLLDPKAVQSFLSRPRDNWLPLKFLKRKEAEALVYPLFDNFYTEPWTHQLVCFALGAELRQFEFTLDMGLGKTLIILNLLHYHILNSGLERTLVLAPSAVNVETWAKQIAKHRPDLRYVKLIGPQEERFKLIEEPADVYLMNYAGLSVYMTELEKKKGKKTLAMVPNKKLVQNFLARFNGVVFDESHLLGSHDSLVFRLCRRLSQSCAFRYGLTGTPFGRDITRLWSQFFLIDHGETLGETLALFRAAFFKGSVNFWGGADWEFDRDKEQELHRILQHRSIRYEDTECHDLPPLAPPERLPVAMSEEQRLYYSRAVRNIKESRGDFEAMKNIFLRMRQITAGFLGFRNEEDERLEIKFDPNPKIEAFKQVLECVPIGSKVVVYHEYLWSGRFICQALDELKIKYARISGLVKGAHQKIANYKQFLEDPATQVLVANSVSAGTGVDELQMVSRFVVFYELPPSPTTYRQAIKRVYRPGQQNRVYVYILEAERSVDAHVFGFLTEGADLFAAICRGDSKAVDLIVGSEV